MSCSKIPYATKQEATSHARTISINQRYLSKKSNRASSKMGKKMHPYECQRCGFWHLTTKKDYKHKRK